MIYLMIILSIVANILSVVAWQILAIAQIKLAKKEATHYTALSLLGLTILLASGGTDIGAISFGPQSLKGILGTLPILLNIPITYLFYFTCNKNNSALQFTKWDMFLNILITIFIAMSAGSFFYDSDYVDYALPPNTTFTLTTQLDAIVYQTVTPTIAVILTLIATLYTQLGSNIAVYAWIDGMFSSLVIMYAKIAQHYSSDISYQVSMGVYIIGALYAFGLKIFVMYKSAKLHTNIIQTQEHITSVTISTTIWNMIAGGVVFDEFTSFSVEQWFLFGFGIGPALILLVVWLVYFHIR